MVTTCSKHTKQPNFPTYIRLVSTEIGRPTTMCAMSDVIHDGEPVRGRLRRVRSGFRYLWRSLRSHSPHRDGASPSPSPDPPPRALRSGLWLSPSLLSIICE